jgi:hypothetical protein
MVTEALTRPPRAHSRAGAAADPGVIRTTEAMHEPRVLVGQSNIQKDRTALIALAVISISACSYQRSELAPGVTREGLRALQPGMTEEQVVALAGHPISSVRGTQGAVLDYAHNSEVRWGEKFSPISGLLIWARFRESALVEVTVLDVDLNQTCKCKVEACSDKWLDACEKHLPSRAR